MSYYVDSGEVESGRVISDTYMILGDGGTAISTTINYYGSMWISSGGLASITTLNSNGSMMVFNGGAANVNTVNSYGKMFVSSGGLANSTTVNNTGSMTVFSGGTANDITVNFNGSMVISSGGTALDIIASSGAALSFVVAPNTWIRGSNYDGKAFEIKNSFVSGMTVLHKLTVSSGGTANDTTVEFKASMTVSNGGVANGNTVKSQASLEVSSGGTANSTTVNPNASMFLSSGGTANSIFLDSSCSLIIQNGAQANILTVGSKTRVDASSGGTANSATINSGGTMFLSGGIANHTIVNPYGYFYVSQGGTASDTTVYAGGQFYVGLSATANQVVVNSGGTMSILGPGTVNGITINPQGSLSVSKGGTAFVENWTPCEGNLWIEEGASVTFASQYSDVYYGSSGQLLSHAPVLQALEISSSVMYVMSGGTASSIAVGRSASMFVSSGGTAINTNLSAFGRIYVYSGGTAIIDDWIPGMGKVWMECGAQVLYTSRYSGIYFGQFDSFAYSGSVLGQTGLFYESAYVMSGGIANGVQVSSGGTVYIYSGGTANSLSVNDRAGLEVTNGGIAKSTYVSRGTMIVSSGGWADYTNVDYGNTNLIVSSGGKVDHTSVSGYCSVFGGSADNTVVYYGSFCVQANGSADNTVLSGGRLTINGGGSADNITVSSGASLYIYANGLANNITLYNGGYIYVGSGGTATNILRSPGEGRIQSASGASITFSIEHFSGVYYESAGIQLSHALAMESMGVGLSCEMHVMTSGTASQITVSSGGIMFVSSGGSANRPMVYSSGSLTVCDGGIANDAYVSSSGRITVLTGGTINQASAVNYGRIIVSNGGLANSTTVTKSGLLYVYDKCVVNSALVSSDGSVYLFSGATLNDLTLSFGQVNLSGGVANRAKVSKGGINIYSGGTANDSILEGTRTFYISALGSIFLQDGGTANRTTINSGGHLTAKTGAVVNSVQVNRCGELVISSGGTALGIVENGGMVYCIEGATASFVANEFSGLLIDLSATVHSGTTATGNTVSGVLDSTSHYPRYAKITVFSGGIANDTKLVFKGQLNLSSGGIGNSTTIESEGYLNIWDGGIGNKTEINDHGSMNVSSGGSAIYTEITTAGRATVWSGGVANWTTLNGWWSVLNVSAGGVANSTTIELDGAAFVDGTVYHTVVFSTNTCNQRGLHIFSGGIAYDTRVYRAGTYFVYAGGFGNGAILDSGGYMWVTSQYLSHAHYAEGDDYGVAINTTVNAYATLCIGNGGIVYDTIVNSRGMCYISSGGKITGNMEFAQDAIVSARSGSILDFDISDLGPGNTSARVNNLSIVKGVPSYTLTVSGTQANGVYLLAEGAANFDSAITVVNDSGVQLGMLSVGYTTTINGNEYTLTRNQDKLTVAINADAAETTERIAPTDSVAGNDTVLVGAVPQAEYMYGCVPTAVGMILGYYDLNGYKNAGFSNLIEGEVDLKSRGKDGNAYDMDAFDTVLGRAIASEEYVYRFVSRNGISTTPAQELEYTFLADQTTLNTDAWNSIADYLGTGQYWRGNDDFSTTLVNGTLKDLYSYNQTEIGESDDPSAYMFNYDQVITISDGSATRNIRFVDRAMECGLDLYVQSRGYRLDDSVSGTYQVDVDGGYFTFTQYMMEIDEGRPVLLNVEGHSMVGYGYNESTQEIIFDDCYESGQRMVWGGTYHYSGLDRKLQSVTLIVLDETSADPGPKKPTVSAVRDEASRTVTVTASFGEDSSVREYSLDGTTWQAYTTAIVLTENESVFFRGTDDAGNVSLVTRYDVESFETETIPEGADVLSGPHSGTVSFSKDVYLEKGASITAAYPGALQLTRDKLRVTLGGDNSLSCVSIRNAGILFGDDAYWTDDYDYGPHYDGTVNFNGDNVSFFSSVSNCITAAGIVGNNLTVSFNRAASGSKNISFESTNRSAGAGNYAAGILADGNLTVNGTFGGDINCHFDFSALTREYKRYAELYGFYAGGNLTVNGDITGNMYLSAVSTLGSYAYGLVAGGDLTVTGVISGIIASTAENYACAIRGDKVNVTVSGTLFAGKSIASEDMTTLIDKIVNQRDTYKYDLSNRALYNSYSVCAGDNSRISFVENALIVGDISLGKNSVVTVSDAACVYGDVTSYYSGSTVVLKLSSKSLNGIRIMSSSWNTSIGLEVDVKDISANGSYSLVWANDLSDQMSVKLSSASRETTLAVGQTAKIGDAEYTLNLNEYGLSLSVAGVQPAPADSIRSDVDGNGISDVMFVWTGNNYQHGYWMNGTSEWQSAGSNHPAEWENLGCYDMTGDGKADSVLVGNVEVGGVKGAYIGYYADANDLPDGSTWVNIGYLNNADDITWKNKVGNLTGGTANSIVWYAPELYALGAWTDGTESWVTLTNDFGGDDWTLVGCGDFDGDGKDSVVMSYNGGQMFYAVDIGGADPQRLGSANWSGWEVRAIGDFSGDGKDDLVLFHLETGSMVMCADGNIDSYVSIGQLDKKDWFVVGAGDYNGDMKDDLLVRQYSTGMLGYYSSGDTSQWVEMGRGVDMNWTVIA